MTTAATGREQPCAHCGMVYRAKRASSRFCSDRCKKRDQRGAAPTSQIGSSLIFTLLLRLGFAGQIGPVNRRDPRPAVYGLTVPRSHAFDELRGLFDRKGWGVLTEAGFAADLKANGVASYDEAPAALRKRR